MSNNAGKIRSRFWRIFFTWTVLRKILSIVIFIGLWTIVVHFIGFFQLLPSPEAVLLAVVDVNLPILLRDIGLSFFRVLAGFFLGVLLGLPIGVLIGYSRVMNHLLFPAFEMVRSIPPIAWIPLAVLFFVSNEAQVIFLTFYGAFFPIVYNTVGGMSEVDIRLPRAAMSFGVKKRQMLWKVILPAATPQIFTGMKLAIGVTWILVVAAEMMSNKGGMGYYIWYNHTTMDYPHVVMGMGIIGLSGAICSIGIGLVGNYFTRWRQIF